MRILFISVVAMLLLAGAVVFGGSTPNVPIDDPVYRDIDQLVAAGLIKDAIYGQRPWSRGEIARMIAQAKRRFQENGGILSDESKMATAIMAEYLIEQLENEYRYELAGKSQFHWLDEISGEAAFLDSASRIVPTENGLGQIHAVINPLTGYREGRHYADGGTFAVESVHSAASKYFSVYARPRFEGLIPKEGSSQADVRAQNLYGKLTLKNLEFEIGRDSLIWGPGEHGGVMASNNPRNLDMVKVSNDSPFVMPWLLIYFGPTKIAAFVGNLGPSYVLNEGYLYGSAVSFKPASFIELGFEHQVTVGGKGAPDVNFGDLVAEFFVYRRGEVHDKNVADHRSGFNIRVDIPQLHHAVVYGEGILEDFGRHSFWPQLTQQMGFLSGVHFPLLTADGSNDLRIEYENIPGAYGRHGIWASGLTQDGRMRGSELGSDGRGVHINWGHIFPSEMRWESALHYENRDSNLYTVSLSPVGGPDKVLVAEDRPSENRFRLTTSLEWRTHGNIRVRPEFGYERVWDFDFNPGSNRNNFLAAVSVKWHPGSK